MAQCTVDCPHDRSQVFHDRMCDVTHSILSGICVWGVCSQVCAMHACACLQALLIKALSHDIEERPSASELRSVLESLLAHL